jgi:hypothetical protein
VSSKRTYVLAVLAIGAVAVAGSFLLQHKRTAHPNGEKLAKTYCASCHLFPEPALFDKLSWTNGALPEMAKWLGLTPGDVERLPSGEIVTDSNVFPPAPLISTEEWDAIVRYYAANAPEELPRPQRPKIAPNTTRFRVKAFPYERRVPMTLMVQIDSQQRRLYVGDAMTHTLEAWTANGERVFGVQFDSGPVSIVGDANTLDVTLVGRAFPSDLLKGKVIRLRPGMDEMQMQKVLGDLRRPVHTARADLNADGRVDYAIAQFGNRKGRLSWFEARATAGFEEHLLLDRPGAICSEVRDMNGDGRPDIIALMGQAWEGVHLFTNQGGGRFAHVTIIEQHPAFGYSDFQLADFDRDGDSDLLTVNGDNGDNGESSAPPKPYHGLRIYLNERGKFTERRFFPLHGAYGARVKDFDGDGDLDIAAISYFPDYGRSPEESFVYFENTGNLVFQPASIPQHAAGRWITMDAGDFDGDGDEDIVLGSLVLGPTSIPIPPTIAEKWRLNAPAILLLENTSR